MVLVECSTSVRRIRYRFRHATLKAFLPRDSSLLHPSLSLFSVFFFFSLTVSDFMFLSFSICSLYFSIPSFPGFHSSYPLFEFQCPEHSSHRPPVFPFPAVHFAKLIKKKHSGSFPLIGGFIVRGFQRRLVFYIIFYSSRVLYCNSSLS